MDTLLVEERVHTGIRSDFLRLSARLIYDSHTITSPAKDCLQWILDKIDYWVCLLGVGMVFCFEGALRRLFLLRPPCQGLWLLLLSRGRLIRRLNIRRLRLECKWREVLDVI